MGAVKGLRWVVLAVMWGMVGLATAGDEALPWLLRADVERGLRAPLASGEQWVKLDAVALAGYGRQRGLRLELPGLAGRYVVRLDKVEHSRSGSLLLGGVVSEAEDDSPALPGAGAAQAGYRLLLSAYEGAVHGRIVTPEGVLQIAPRDGGLVLANAALGGWQQPVGEARCEGAVPPAGERLEAVGGAGLGAGGLEAELGAGGLEAGGLGAAAHSRAGEARTTVDVLLIYSTAMQQVHDAASLQARLDLLLAAGNQAYEDSGAGVMLREVARVAMAFDSDESNGALLDRITPASGGGSGGSALSRQISELRDRHGADVVVVVRPFDNRFHGNCGTAWIGGYQGSALQERWAHAVVSDGKSLDGSLWFCGDSTLVHEVGHTLGLTHDWGQADAGTGAYRFGNGYGISGRFGTIMSYIEPEVLYFSNPERLCAGLTCGRAAGLTQPADAVQALNLAAPQAAAFRAALTPVNQPPQIVMSGGLTVAAGSEVSLSASASDVDGQIVGVLWEQTGGTPVVIRNANRLQAAFTAPEQAATLDFRLTVSDDDGARSSAELRVTVLAPSSPGTQDGLASDEGFIRQQYADFLGRAPLTSELGFWLDALDSGRSDRAGLITSLLGDEQLQQRLPPLIRLYLAYFERAPDHDGLQYWLQVLAPAGALGGMQPRIVGGTVAAAGEWPGMMSLERRERDGSFAHFCAATLIAPGWALSAAHCVDGRSLSSMRLRAGSLLLGEGGELRTLRRVIMHPEHDALSLRHDLALLELDTTLTLTPTPLLATAGVDGTPVRVLGWGHTATGGALSQRLLEGSLSLIERERCANGFGYAAGEILPGMVCAGTEDGTVDACQGDSGGPLLAADGAGRWRQLGIVSWGEDCGDVRFPGVYTELAPYLPWLSAHTGVSFAAPPPALVARLDGISGVFTRSAEFVARYGALDDRGFVELVYRNVLGRVPDQDGEEYWLGMLGAGLSRGELMTRFSESAEYVALTAELVQVIVVYAAMLEREPSLQELAWWTGRRGLVEALLESVEYVSRVGGE